MVFLAATVAVVPLCKKVNVSPVLGFLLAGVLLGPAGIGVLKDLSDLDTLGEIGILFLLFEQVCAVKPTRARLIHAVV